MKKEFKSIALIGRFADPRVAEPMNQLATHLTSAGVSVMAVDEVAEGLGVEKVSAKDIPDRADLIVAIGGDGTMLHAASLTRDADIPLLGVNRGRLGFLADVTPAEMLESFDSIMSGNYSSESRIRLVATLLSSDGNRRTALALNDIVLQRRDTGRMLDFETRIADRYVNTHMGDGLIVATPTGSTAYALSCNGPIVEPQLDVVIVVPICPHTLSDRPIVVPAEHSIRVTLLARDDTRAEVAADGHALGEFIAGDRLFIERSPNRITLIHPPGYDYYEILRSKLHWGQDVRRRALQDIG